MRDPDFDKIAKITTVVASIVVILSVIYGFYLLNIIGSNLQIKDLSVIETKDPSKSIVVSFYLYNAGIKPLL